jgi:hypothetical protein
MRERRSDWEVANAPDEAPVMAKLKAAATPNSRLALRRGARLAVSVMLRLQDADA